MLCKYTQIISAENLTIEKFYLYAYSEYSFRSPRTSTEVDNSFIVPYKPFLSFRYNCQLNFEREHIILSVKYLLK